MSLIRLVPDFNGFGSWTARSWQSSASYASFLDLFGEKSVWATPREQSRAEHDSKGARGFRHASLRPAHLITERLDINRRPIPITDLAQ